MKNVLIVVGSARNGSSRHIGETAKRALMETKCNAEFIQLSDYKINYCDGCLSCDTTGACHHNDDMAGLLDKVKSANGVIFISPTRWSLLSGDMKVFMDRWNPLAGKNLFDNKYSYIVAVGQTNTNESESIEKALTSLRYFSEDAGFKLVGEYVFENCYGSDDIKNQSAQLQEFSNKIKAFANAITE